MHGILEANATLAMYRYADDNVIVSQGSNVYHSILLLQKAAKTIIKWINTLNVSINNSESVTNITKAYIYLIPGTA